MNLKELVDMTVETKTRVPYERVQSHTVDPKLRQEYVEHRD